MDEHKLAAAIRKIISGMEDMLAALEDTPAPDDGQPTLIERSRGMPAVRRRS